MYVLSKQNTLQMNNAQEVISLFFEIDVHCKSVYERTDS